jgi:hypothetical protein
MYNWCGDFVWGVECGVCVCDMLAVNIGNLYPKTEGKNTNCYFPQYCVCIYLTAGEENRLFIYIMKTR